MSHVRVVAAVLQRDGQVLVCRRPLDKRHGGLWEFPGGKVEPGETTLDAVRRELGEELGLEVLSVGRTQLSVPDPGSQFLIEFVDVEAHGQPTPVEHSEVAWIRPKELPTLPLAPSDRVFAQRLMEDGG